MNTLKGLIKILQDPKGFDNYFSGNGILKDIMRCFRNFVQDMCKILDIGAI